MLGNKDSVSLGTQHRKPGSTREAFRRSAIGNDGANVRPVRCASKEPGSPSKPITTHAHHASTSFPGPTNPTAELSSSVGRGHQGRPSDAKRETYLTGHRGERLKHYAGHSPTKAKASPNRSNKGRKGALARGECPVPTRLLGAGPGRAGRCPVPAKPARCPLLEPPWSPTSARPSITKVNVEGKAHGHGRVGELLPPYSAFIAEMPPLPGTHFLHKANHTFFF